MMAETRPIEPQFPESAHHLASGLVRARPQSDTIIEMDGYPRPGIGDNTPLLSPSNSEPKPTPLTDSDSSLLARIAKLISHWRNVKYAGSDGRYDNFHHERLEDYPVGYPRLASYMTSSPQFQQYRRFATLRNRVILHRQQELVMMEKELHEMDLLDSHCDNSRIRCLRVDRNDPSSTRTPLVNNIDQKLKEYDELLFREQKMMTMARPSKHNRLSLFNYVWNRKPMVLSEMDYLNQIDDFVMLSQDENSYFGELLETLLYLFPTQWVKNLFSTEAQQARTQDRYISLLDKNRVNRLIRTIVTTITVALLIIPVCLLFKVQASDNAKIVVLLVFTLLFSSAVSIFGKVKNHELFAMTAAYCAVLVVFLGNLSNGSTSASNSKQPSPAAVTMVRSST